MLTSLDSTFRQFMIGQVRIWLSATTGVKLSENVALTGSRYGSTDCLLPHDDKLEVRIFNSNKNYFLEWIFPNYKFPHFRVAHLLLFFI